MKRQHDPSLLQNSSNKVESACALNCKNKKDFVAEWISNLPEPMHRIKKQPRKASNHQNLEAQKESAFKPSARNNNFNRMDFVSALYGTKVENLDPIVISEDSEQCEDTKMNDNMLNLTLVEIEANDDVSCVDSESSGSWETTSIHHNYEVYNLVEFPSNAVIYRKAFKDLSIEEAIERSEPFKVTILEIVSPFKFWFILENRRKAWREQMNEMDRIYDAMKAEEFRMVYTHIFPQQICAVPLHVGWARGIIQSYLLGSTVKVFLVDFGIEVKLSPKVLKYLKIEFMDLPRLALRGTLAYIKPKVKDVWPSSARKLFYDLICCESLTAKLVEIKNVGEKKIFHLDIRKRNSDIYISKLLVDKGFAEYKDKYANR